MDIFQIFALALIQGISEFLPISSSAHLILPSQLLGWSDQGLLFDVAVHVGSLSAVIFYFRHELRTMACAWLASIRSNRSLWPQTVGGGSRTDAHANINTADAQMAWMLIFATLPALAAGFLAKDFIGLHLRSITVIASTTVLFGLLLGVAELHSRRAREYVPLTLKIAMIIGVAQVLALVPGTSRSGITITAAVLLGMSKKEGAHFSFLLSIPIIFAAGCLLGVDLLDQPVEFDWMALVIAISVSAISAWCCIALFLKLIERIGLMPFVWYRLALGAVLFALVFVPAA